MFNRNFLVYLAGSALAVGLASCGNNNQPNIASPQSAGATPTTQTVSIPMNAVGMGAQAFGTNPLVINAGDSVQWMNNDTVAHTATSGNGTPDGVFDTGPIQPGAMSSPVPFPSPGTFPYFCTIHDFQSMNGVIQVNGASPSPSVSPSASPTTSPSVSPAPVPSESVSPSPSPSEVTPSPTETVTPQPTETATPIPTSTSPKQGPPETTVEPTEPVFPVNPGFPDEGCDDDQGEHHDRHWCDDHGGNEWSARMPRAHNHR